MLFVSFYKSLIERDLKITIELKNGLIFTGKMAYVDTNMNFFLKNIEVEEPTKYP